MHSAQTGSRASATSWLSSTATTHGDGAWSAGMPIAEADESAGGCPDVGSSDASASFQSADDADGRSDVGSSDASAPVQSPDDADGRSDVAPIKSSRAWVFWKAPLQVSKPIVWDAVQYKPTNPQQAIFQWAWELHQGPTSPPTRLRLLDLGAMFKDRKVKEVKLTLNVQLSVPTPGSSQKEIVCFKTTNGDYTQLTAKHTVSCRRLRLEEVVRVSARSELLRLGLFNVSSTRSNGNSLAVADAD